jgi:putative DNA methylase
VWDFAEANPFSASAGNYSNAIDWIVKALANTPALGPAEITQGDAVTSDYVFPSFVISTDPPYYDNIPYADLSDFFYVWLKRTAGPIWPDLFRRLQTPKSEELVAAAYRQGGREQSERHFVEGMGRALRAMRAGCDPNLPLTIFYAFKQSERTADGFSSPGWATFLQAVLDAGLVVDGTWPLRTELANRMRGIDANALASSIVLACRCRPSTATSTTRRDFVAELRRELPKALDRMRAAGLHPVDKPQSALGPGMEVFSKYAPVREADDSAMTVPRAIALINQVRGEIDHADAGALDAATRFAIDWFVSFGWAERDAGEAIKLAQSYDLTEKQLRDGGLLVAERGKARLLRRGEMKDDWRPSRDTTLTTWELAQALNRALNDRGGAAEAGALLREAQALAVDARWLTGRLFGIAEDRRMPEEARSWGRLSEAWDEIMAAADRGSEPAAAGAQSELF